MNEDGTRRVWRTPDYTEERPKEEHIRTMDCVDCHNRPTHIYLGPDEALDQWMATEQIDSSIPWIRKLAIEVITPPYATTEEAMEGIARLPELYKERYPEHWAEYEAKVRETVPALQDIHRAFVFPSMNIQWHTYNSNIGHATQYNQACFRCHNGVLRDDTDESITLDCTSCHYILANRETDPRILDRLGQR